MTEPVPSELVRDYAEEWPVAATEQRFQGRVFGVRTDSVVMPDDEVVERDYATHIGSVAVVAVDEEGRVLLLRQYRHAVRHQLWELPAGLRDVDGEPPVETAARELAEEAGFQAEHWHALVDLMSSPGMTDERIRVFLARRLSPVRTDFVRRHEEADMPVEWLPLAEAVRHVLGGMIHNSPAVAGILAAYTASADGFATVRPADAPEA